MNQYQLRWRGNESGPHSLAEIERLLDDGRISIWHEVAQNGQWITVQELLRSAVPSTPVAVKKTRPTESSDSTAGGKAPRTLPRMNQRNANPRK